MKKVIILQLFLLFVFSSCRRSQKQYQCTCTFGAYQAVGQQKTFKLPASTKGLREKLGFTDQE